SDTAGTARDPRRGTCRGRGVRGCAGWVPDRGVRREIWCQWRLGWNGRREGRDRERRGQQKRLRQDACARKCSVSAFERESQGRGSRMGRIVAWSGGKNQDICARRSRLFGLGEWGQGTEWTAKMRYGPGSQFVNLPVSRDSFAVSKLSKRQCAFVGRSLASELHDRGEHSCEFPAKNVTTSNPSSCFVGGTWTSVGNEGSGEKRTHCSPSN